MGEHGGNVGNGGNGARKVQLIEHTAAIGPETILSVRHAKRGSVEEKMALDEFLNMGEPYFDGQGRMIDQAYQPRLTEGMVRCYLVHDKIVGFGHQAVNALFPAPPGAPPSDAPQPGPRLYHPPTLPDSQLIKRKEETVWVPAMQRLLDIRTEHLPILRDCDFILGPKRLSGEDAYVLCEINVSNTFKCQSAQALIICLTGMGKTDNS